MWNQAMNSSQPFVFAYGDPTGYGYHGDFINGWDVNVLQNAVTNCNDNSGDMTKCSYFNFLPNSVSAGCHIPSYIQEDVLGASTPLPKLPGCNAVQKGPGYATNTYNTCNDQPKIALSTSYMTDVTAKYKYKYVGCALDNINGARSLSSASTSGNTMTVESCVSYCSGKGYSYAGLEYSSQCYCGNSLPSGAAPVTVSHIPDLLTAFMANITTGSIRSMHHDLRRKHYRNLRWSQRPQPVPEVHWQHLYQQHLRPSGRRSSGALSVDRGSGCVHDGKEIFSFIPTIVAHLPAFCGRLCLDGFMEICHEKYKIWLHREWHKPLAPSTEPHSYLPLRRFVIVDVVALSCVSTATCV